MRSFCLSYYYIDHYNIRAEGREARDWREELRSDGGDMG